jgi:sporulation integral membrane protein YtvI
MSEKLARALLAGLGLMLGAGALFLAGRYLLPWTAPLLTAWAFAALLEPPVGFLARRGWKRGAAAGLCTLAALGLLLWGLAELLTRGLSAAAELTKALPALVEAVGARFEALRGLLEAHIRAAPEPAAAYLEGALSALESGAAALPGQLSRALVSLLSKTAQASPDTLLFFVTAALGTYFISAAFPTVNAFLLAQLPQSLRRRLEGLGADLKSGFGGLLRAQLLLLGLCFLELLAVFLLLGVPSAPMAAAATALIDALPVFGTGAVLLPWAAGCLLLGNTRRGLGLLAAWGLAELTRNAAQAKLLGDQIGLNPLASLLSVYVGWRVGGVGGMLLFPLGAMALIRLNERGVVRLWRNV